MKLFLALCATTALAVVPPRIELDLTNNNGKWKQLDSEIFRPHNDGLRQPDGTLVKSRQDYSARCTARQSDITSCPFPIAKAWDHQDKDISERLVTRVYQVDRDGHTCGTSAYDCDCQSPSDPTCAVTEVDFNRRSTYLFKYDVTDRSGNHAEQVVFALILDDACGNQGLSTAQHSKWCTPYIEMCGTNAETWQAASSQKLCGDTPKGTHASDNIDSDSVMESRLMYDIQTLDWDDNTPQSYVCRNQDWKYFTDYREDEIAGKQLGTAPCAVHKLATTNVGKYLITWHVCDKAGVYGHGSRDNCFSRRKVVVIEDTLQPWIDMHGFNPYVQECHQHSENHANCADRTNKDCWAYEDAGAVVKDLLDTEALGLDISQACTTEITAGCLQTGGSVDSSVDGSNWNITYNAWDTNGNEAQQQTRKVQVRDRRAPTAELVQPELSAIVHYPGDYILANGDGETVEHLILANETGFTCKDDCDLTPTKTLGWENRSFVCNEGNCPLGDYVRTYTCTDHASEGALSHTVTRTYTIMDKHKPIIVARPAAYAECGGKVDCTLEASVAKEYTDTGATCSDFIDGELSHAVEVSGEVVNMRIPGEYRIRYDCQDLSGNPADAKQRVITIVDTTCPHVDLQGPATVYIESGFEFLDYHKATATDTLDGDITKEIFTYGNTVNENKAFKQFLSCKQIKTYYPEAKSGPYFITIAGNEVEVVCDMDSEEYAVTYKACKDCDAVAPYGATNGGCASFGMQMMKWNTTNKATRLWAQHPSRFGMDYFPVGCRADKYFEGTDCDDSSANYLCTVDDESLSEPADTTIAKHIARDGTYYIKYFVHDKAGNNQETKKDGTPCDSRGAGVDLTPTRKVVVQDTLPPVITLHMDNNKDAVDAEKLVVKSDGLLASHKLNDLSRAQSDAHPHGNYTEFHGINPANYPRDEYGVGNPHLVGDPETPLTPNSFATDLMAEQHTSVNVWFVGAVASAVAGVALLAAAGRNRRATTVEV